MVADLADRFGVKDKFTEGRTQEEWVRYTLDQSRKEIPELPSYEELKERGVWRREGKSVIALEDFRKDPEAHPLETPSGKIEIFSSELHEMAKVWEFDAAVVGDKLTALPEYVETWEGAEAAAASDTYPLQVIGHHTKGRTHSSYANVDWLRDDAHPQILWINPIDAQARGIRNDDNVYAYNDRGRIRSIARVTPRIAPGVISVPQGSWFNPQDGGVDIGASVNTLTSWPPSPLAKGNAQHTAICQVEKA